MENVSNKNEQKAASAFKELVKIISKLRAPDGCPWDREQTHDTLKPYVIEECYEVVDAIDGGDPSELREELGDLLLQIMLHAQIASEEGIFEVSDVVEGLSAKLVTRHPHVFGDVEVSGSSEVLTNWEKIKKREKEDKGLFDGLPRHLPNLQRAARMGEKAKRVGFDWADASSVREKVIEELHELDEAIEQGAHSHIEHELGDLLFACAQWARHLDQMPEEALRSACDRFSSRFSNVLRIVNESGKDPSDLAVEQLEKIWQKVKSDEPKKR